MIVPISSIHESTLRPIKSLQSVISVRQCSVETDEMSSQIAAADRPS